VNLKQHVVQKQARAGSNQVFYLQSMLASALTRPQDSFRNESIAFGFPVESLIKRVNSRNAMTHSIQSDPLFAFKPGFAFIF
jgi:hypothetical protein